MDEKTCHSTTEKMMAQQVLLVAVVLGSVASTYPPNPILEGMQRRYGGGGGYPNLKLPFPIPVKPGLLSKLEDVALDVLYDFRNLQRVRSSESLADIVKEIQKKQLVKEEIRNSRTTTTAMPPAESLQQQINDLQKKVGCQTDEQASAPVKASDSSLLGLSFKDDCVQIAIGGQKIFRRCGQQGGRQRTFRTLPESRMMVLPATSIQHDSTFVKAQPFPGNSDFESHPGTFSNNKTQHGQPPNNFNLPPLSPDQNEPPHRRPDGPSTHFSSPPVNQNHPPSSGTRQNLGPVPMMPHYPYSKGAFPQPFNTKGGYAPSFPQPLGGNSWQPPPFDQKSWNMPPYGSKSWTMPPYDTKSWNMPPYGSKSWNMPPYDGKSWNMPPYDGKSWNMPMYGGKSWYPQSFGDKSWYPPPPLLHGNIQPPFNGNGWYQPPVGTKSWNMPPPMGTKSWNVPPPVGTKSWFQPPLVEPHGFISPEKGGFYGHSNFRGLEPPRPPPPPPPAGTGFDDPYYNRPFDFHKHPIQNYYFQPRYYNAAGEESQPVADAPVEPAMHRRGKSINAKDEGLKADDGRNSNGYETIPFPNSMKGTFSSPDTDLESVLAKAASLPRKPGDPDPMLVVAMPKGDDALPGEYHPPVFVPLNFQRRSDDDAPSEPSFSQDSYLPRVEVLERPTQEYS